MSSCRADFCFLVFLTGFIGLEFICRDSNFCYKAMEKVKTNSKVLIQLITLRILGQNIKSIEGEVTERKIIADFNFQNITVTTTEKI